MKMNPEIKAKWVAALRSGEYEQAREHLTTGGAYCCLGVLCALYSLENGGDAIEDLKAEGTDEIPNEDVCEWALLPDNDPDVVISGVKASLSTHNDGATSVSRRTFFEIAKAIEEQL